jgi:dihydrodiol dehydrogenase / D-xylose 1-dehydrogenase (NADP)
MQLKIGILSAALISNDFVISLRNLDPCHYKVVAIAATSIDKANEFADRLNIQKAYGSYQELATDPEVQLVYIANLNIYH